MRSIASVTVAVLLIIGVGVAVVGGTGGSVSSSPVNLVADVTPAGWVPVDYGNAQISVPSSWTIGYDDICQVPRDAGAIYVGESTLTGISIVCQDFSHSSSPPPVVSIGPLTSQQHIPGSRPTEINGIPVWRSTLREQTTDLQADLQIPDLGISISTNGPAANRVLDTLTYSPAAVALANGPAPDVPSSWKWVTTGNLEVAVPSGWQQDATTVEGPECVAEFTVRESDRVVIDTDAVNGATAGCPIIREPTNPPEPQNGLVIDLHPDGDWPQGLPGNDCLTLQGVKVCPYTRDVTLGYDGRAETDILFAQVTVQSTGRPHLVEIGLAGNGMTARTILYSLKVA